MPYPAGGTSDILSRLLSPKLNEVFGNWLKSEIEKWAKVVKAANLKLD